MKEIKYNKDELKEKEVNILNEFKKTCNDNNLEYYLAFGTLLGAIRHKGFIPWDDDIDVNMKGDDYYKLRKLMIKNRKSKYFYQCLKTEKYYPFYFAKLRLNNTLVIEKKLEFENINSGIFIDIFPLIPYPNNKRDRKKLYQKRNIINLLIEADLIDKTKYNNYGKTGKIISKCLKIIPRKIRNVLADFLLKNMIFYKKEYDNYIDLMDNKVFSVSSFNDKCNVTFEKEKYKAPKEYDKYLTEIYGDYMKIPKENERQEHQFISVDFNTDKIDIVLPWVDGGDREWQKEKAKYDTRKKTNGSNAEVRYRDWDNLKYLFRGIEKYAPWVNNVYFITCGHLPKWLNKDNPKLKIISHKDYIPSEYLPTFSSNPIELNIHRIKDLSEKFILFNDDMFLINNVDKDDFFINNKPCDNYCEVNLDLSNEDETFASMLRNNYKIVNKYYNKKDVLKKYIGKCFNYKYGLKRNMQTIKTSLTKKDFMGISNNHLPQPFLKYYYRKLWDLEYETFNKTSMNKFRTKNDVTEWLIRYFNILDGNFIPRDYKLGKFFVVGENNNELTEVITKQKTKIVCINDSDKNIDFDKCKEEINSAFDVILKEKSSFEK